MAPRALQTTAASRSSATRTRSGMRSSLTCVRPPPSPRPRRARAAALAAARPTWRPRAADPKELLEALIAMAVNDARRG